MLINLISCAPDFETTIKRRTRLLQGLAVLGVIGLVCYATLVPNSPLPDFVRGVYAGVSCGLIFASVIGLARVAWLKKHPEAWKKAAIQNNDERERAVSAKALQTAALVTFFLSGAAMLIVAPFSLAAFWALWGEMICFALILLIAAQVYSRIL